LKQGLKKIPWRETMTWKIFQNFKKENYRGKNVLEFHDSWRSSLQFLPLWQKTWKKS
jgi:hypothetical protein